MQLSAEVRWFRSGVVPDAFRTWFLEPAAGFRSPVGGGRVRKDIYLQIKEPELNIKRRGGKPGLDVKGLLDVLPTQLAFGRVAVTPQMFCKWSSEELDFAALPTVEVVKTRWMRQFDTAPDQPREITLGSGEFAEEPAVTSERLDVGCNVELTEIVRRNESWWTFGAESFAFGQPGRTTELIRDALFRTMQMLSRLGDVDLRAAEYLNYGKWIALK
jgi:hypothetical protein